MRIDIFQIQTGFFLGNGGPIPQKMGGVCLYANMQTGDRVSLAADAKKLLLHRKGLSGASQMPIANTYSKCLKINLAMIVNQAHSST